MEAIMAAAAAATNSAADEQNVREHHHLDRRRRQLRDQLLRTYPHGSHTHASSFFAGDDCLATPLQRRYPWSAPQEPGDSVSRSSASDGGGKGWFAGLTGGGTVGGSKNSTPPPLAHHEEQAIRAAFSSSASPCASSDTATPAMSAPSPDSDSSSSLSRTGSSLASALPSIFSSSSSPAETTISSAASSSSAPASPARSWNPFASEPTSTSAPSSRHSPVLIALTSATSAAVLTFIAIKSHRRYLRRYRTAADIPPALLNSSDTKTPPRRIKGIVTAVGDGDNFRLYHTPSGLVPLYRLGLLSIPNTPKQLVNQTISIRIAGVDAPECAHFGREAQPHSSESLEWLRQLLLRPKRRKVVCEVMRRDQYGRIVAIPYLPRAIPFLPAQPLPLLMLRAGVASIYESSIGAEYGPWGLEGLKKVEDEARKARKGLWAQTGKIETPGEYKKRHRVEEEPAPATSKKATNSGGLWSWLTSWIK